VAAFSSHSFHVHKDTWYLDSAASDHITNSLDYYTAIDEVPAGSTITGGTGLTCIASRGTVILNVATPGGPSTLKLQDVYYAPGFATNVVCASKLVDKGFDLDLRACTISNHKDGVHLASFERKGPMYVLSILPNPESRVMAFHTTTTS
jgi:hypothetical protein